MFSSKNTIARRVDWVFVTAVALASVAALAGLALALKLKAGWLDVFGTGNHWYPARTWPGNHPNNWRFKWENHL